jgi:hypothetical protein
MDTRKNLKQSQGLQCESGTLRLYNSSALWFPNSRGRPQLPVTETEENIDILIKMNSMRNHKQLKWKPGLLNQSNGLMPGDSIVERWSQNCDQPEQPAKEAETERIVKFKNLFSMKSKLLIFRGILLILLALAGTGRAWAQGPFPNQGPHTVCIGDVAPYGVINTPGSTYVWSVVPLTGGNGIVAPGNSNLTSVTWNSSGTCYIQVIETNSAGCIGIPGQILITVTPLNTITLSSTVGTDAQTVCINSAITNITYATTGATGATFAGLPAGVTGGFAGNTVTISGTPTVSGPFSYTVTLTGGCGLVTANGTINVTPDNTITLSSAAGTNAQTVCINTAITNITYATTGATGATFAGLPAGVTGGFAGNTVTISGTPTVSGPFNYTVTLTGGCGTVTANGTLSVTPANTITLSSAVGTNAQTVCINTAITSITYATTGATGATFAGLPAGVTGSFAGNTVTISGTPTVSGPFSYTVTLTGGCGTVTANGTLSVTPDNTITLSSAAGTNAQTVCINSAITSITYTTTGATGATFAGLPAGVTGGFAGNTVTISGTPTVSGPFSYTVTLTGGCGTVTANGTLSVTPVNTITLSSVVGTNAQTVCINSAITNITYATTGATGATFAGLPAGVTGGFAGNTVTISGTPTASGPFSYTVTLTGGCGTITANGTITVNPLPVPTITPTVNPVCFGTTGVVYTTEAGMTNYTWVVTGGLVTAGGTPTDNTVTITWNGAGPYSVSVNYNNANGCVATTPTIFNVVVTPLPVTSPIYHN